MKRLKFINIVTGWVVFLIAAVVYLLTIEPTASFWDCGEFIASAYKMEVGHPPGAPFFMIVARFFTLFAGDDVTNVASMVNSLSALASAFTILFLFWTITHLGRKVILKDDSVSMSQTIIIIGSGLVGALAYTFSDTFWFSAVEGEVYASSSLFTALVFWAILKWENTANEKYANRWLILIAYLMGLSIGVHLLNLLAIPAIVFVYYFKKYKVSRNGIIAASAVSVVLLGVIMYGILPGIVKVASSLELFFVNTLGMPFNSGVLIYTFLLLTSMVAGSYYTMNSKNSTLNGILVGLLLFLLGIPFMGHNAFLAIILIGAIIGFIYFVKENRVLLNTILVASTVIVLGYSSFAMIVIRSLADPPMDQNNPETLFGLQYYLNREQYGDRPLFFGQYYNAPIKETKEKKPVYTQIGEKYKITNRKLEYIYDNKFTTFFPRMYSRESNHVRAYKDWAKIRGKPVRTVKENGETGTINKPTFLENLRFFFRYQIGFMYGRYFMWNFAGRQNDVQGHGYNSDGSRDVLNGNWLSGIRFIDEMRLGPQDHLPEKIKDHKARNKYYFLPLLLGLLGAYFHYKKHKQDFVVVTLLFVMTGIAIVLYLNQTPYQPRERDYAYAGSFYAFSIWIGLGVLALYNATKKIGIDSLRGGIIALACLVLVPGIMAKENYDDHDRSDRYTARDFAYNYLNSCAPNAILFTNGDNDTFPLWYIQEVEGVRTDVRVVNLSYLSADWYIEQMQRKAYDSDPVPFSLSKDKYIQGTRDVVYLIDRMKKPANLKEAIKFVASDDPRTKQISGYRDAIDYFPSKSFTIPVDSQKIFETGTLSPKFAPEMVEDIEWKINRRYITKNDLMVLDLLANNEWERPVYFAITVARENYLNLEEFFQIQGLAYRIVPVKSELREGQVTGIDTDIMYDNMINKFKWGGIDTADVYLDENNLRMLSNFRNNFSRLSEELYNEGKPDSAEVVIDRAMEIMPHDIVPFNYFVIPIAEMYYRLNKIDKANEIITKLSEIITDEVDYYFRFTNDLSNSVDYEKRLGLHILQEIIRITGEYGQNEISQEMQDKFQQYVLLMNPGS